MTPGALGQPTEALLHALFERGAQIPLSFEMFPPRTAAGRRFMMETVAALAGAATAGFSVTMGAGGSTRDGTRQAAVEIAQATGRPVMAHLIARGLTRQEALETADAIWHAGITRILALRGDTPRGASGELPEGFAHAADLVAALADRHPFEIAVAAHPEKHPEAATLDQDIDYLKAKIDAGAGRAICQFVLNPEAYGRFLDACARHGIDVPIVPGLMPLTNWPRIRSFARENGASVPDWLDRLLCADAEAPEAASLAGFAATVEQVRRLVAYGAPALHVYALNRWPMPLALARILGHPHGRYRPTDPD